MQQTRPNPNPNANPNPNPSPNPNPTPKAIVPKTLKEDAEEHKKRVRLQGAAHVAPAQDDSSSSPSEDEL